MSLVINSMAFWGEAIVEKREGLREKGWWGIVSLPDDGLTVADVRAVLERLKGERCGEEKEALVEVGVLAFWGKCKQ